jgi:hypothetical protein
MLRTAFVVVSIVASVLIPTTVLQARGGGGHGGEGHGGAGGSGGAVHVGGGGLHVGGGRVHAGGGPGVRVVDGGGRRFWHGRWYAYGVGPCWRLTPGGYVWVCG